MKMGGGGGGAGGSPTAPLWVRRTDFPRVQSRPAGGGVIGSKLYAGGGLTGGVGSALFHEWDAANNLWTSKANMPEGMSGRTQAPCAIGTKVYLGPNNFNAASSALVSNLYEWDQGSNTWATKTASPVATSSAFTMCSDGIDLYTFATTFPATTLRCHRWTQASNTWTQIATVALGTLSGLTGTTGASTIWPPSWVGQYCFVPILFGNISAPVTRMVTFDKTSNTFTATSNVPPINTTGGFATTPIAYDALHPTDYGNVFILTSNSGGGTGPTVWRVLQAGVSVIASHFYRTGSGRLPAQGLEDPPEQAFGWWGTINDQVFWLVESSNHFWLRSTLSSSGGLSLGLSLN